MTIVLISHVQLPHRHICCNVMTEHTHLNIFTVGEKFFLFLFCFFFLELILFHSWNLMAMERAEQICFKPLLKKKNSTVWKKILREFKKSFKLKIWSSLSIFFYDIILLNMSFFFHFFWIFLYFSLQQICSNKFQLLARVKNISLALQK
jgi:hypothetical protein